MAKFKSNYEMTLVEEIKVARAAEAGAEKSVKKKFEMPTFNADWQERKLRYDNYTANPDYTLGGVSSPGAAPTAPTHYSKTESVSSFAIYCAIRGDRRLKKYPIPIAEYAEQRATGGRRVIK